MCIYFSYICEQGIVLVVCKLDLPVHTRIAVHHCQLDRHKKKMYVQSTQDSFFYLNKY